jgi:IS5 family transposase
MVICLGQPRNCLLSKLRIHKKGCKNNPLNEEQKATNKAKASFRVRVEHVFGFIENRINGMMNLVYNMFRKIQLQAI